MGTIILVTWLYIKQKHTQYTYNMTQRLDKLSVLIIKYFPIPRYCNKFTAIFNSLEFQISECTVVFHNNVLQNINIVQPTEILQFSR